MVVLFSQNIFSSPEVDVFDGCAELSLALDVIRTQDPALVEMISRFGRILNGTALEIVRIGIGFGFFGKRLEVRLAQSNALAIAELEARPLRLELRKKS